MISTRINTHRLHGCWQEVQRYHSDLDEQILLMGLPLHLTEDFLMQIKDPKK